MSRGMMIDEKKGVNSRRKELDMTQCKNFLLRYNAKRK